MQRIISNCRCSTYISVCHAQTNGCSGNDVCVSGKKGSRRASLYSMS
jgi:hypothetical protein